MPALEIDPALVERILNKAHHIVSRCSLVELAIAETLAALRESGRLVEWRPIADAKTDGTVYTVWVEGREGLPPFVTHCAYHPDAGWCVDELREVTHFLAPMVPPATAATEGE